MAENIKLDFEIQISSPNEVLSLAQAIVDVSARYKAENRDCDMYAFADIFSTHMVVALRSMLPESHLIQQQEKEVQRRLETLVNPVAAFTKECFVEGEFVTFSDVWNTWKHWAEVNNIPIRKKVALSKKLAKEGFMRARLSTQPDGSRPVAYVGFSINPMWT